MLAASRPWLSARWRTLLRKAETRRPATGSKMPGAIQQVAGGARSGVRKDLIATARQRDVVGQARVRDCGVIGRQAVGVGQAVDVRCRSGADDRREVLVLHQHPHDVLDLGGARNGRSGCGRCRHYRRAVRRSFVLAVMGMTAVMTAAVTAGVTAPVTGAATVTGASRSVLPTCQDCGRTGQKRRHDQAYEYPESSHGDPSLLPCGLPSPSSLPFDLVPIQARTPEGRRNRNASVGQEEAADCRAHHAKASLVEAGTTAAVYSLSMWGRHNSTPSPRSRRRPASASDPSSFTKRAASVAMTAGACYPRERIPTLLP